MTLRHPNGLPRTGRLVRTVAGGGERERGDGGGDREGGRGHGLPAAAATQRGAAVGQVGVDLVGGGRRGQRTGEHGDDLGHPERGPGGDDTRQPRPYGKIHNFIVHPSARRILTGR